MIVSHEEMLSKQEQVRESASIQYADDIVLEQIATESSLDTIIDIIDRNPGRNIHLPIPRWGGYILDAMNVYRRILKAGGEYRGYRFDLYEDDSDTPLTWAQAQHLIEHPYHGYPVFRLRMHDDTGRVDVEWPIPFSMLAPEPFSMLADNQPTA